MKAWQGSVSISRIRGIVSPAYFTYCATHAEDQRFLNYLMRSQRYITGYLSLSKGIRVNQWDLEPQYHSRMPVLLPPRDEQRRIAELLDYETAKIDALVEEQQRLIELLKEKRQAVISQAVTKGLDPNVPMKDSGVEWLGKVPSHWAVKRLKQVSPRVTVGIVVEPSKHYAETGVPALRSLNLRQDAIEPDGMVFITPEGHSLHSKSRLNTGDLVAVRSGQPGTTAVVPPDLDGCNCIDLLVIRQPADGCSEYLSRFMNSDAARIQYTHGSGGAIQQHFNVEAAGNLVLAWPPLKEQLAITSAIARQLRQFDELIEDATSGMRLLGERRSALISAAVTGKIDVRGLAPQPEAVVA
jgi:type I restriction enzyme S subunit